jgi:hypothetical protein
MKKSHLLTVVTFSCGLFIGFCAARLVAGATNFASNASSEAHTLSTLKEITASSQEIEAEQASGKSVLRESRYGCEGSLLFRYKNKGDGYLKKLGSSLVDSRVVEDGSFLKVVDGWGTVLRLEVTVSDEKCLWTAVSAGADKAHFTVDDLRAEGR